MASIQKRGKGWRAFVARNGVRTSKTFLSKREAQDWAAEQELAIKTPHLTRLSISDALDLYLNDPINQRNKYIDRTYKSVKNSLKSVLNLDISSLPVEYIISLRDKLILEFKPNTVLKKLNDIRVVYAWLRDKRKTTHDPFKGVKLPRQGTPRTRIWSEVEISNLLKYLGYTMDKEPTTPSHWVGAMVVIAVETAMRRGEILSITPENVDLVKRVVHLPTTKNGDARNVPLSSRALEVFRRILPCSGKYVLNCGTQKLQWAFHKACVASKIHGATFHDLRATAITRLSRKLTIYDLARVSGHRNINQLMTYYRTSVTDIAALMD